MNGIVWTRFRGREWAQTLAVSDFEELVKRFGRRETS